MTLLAAVVCDHFVMQVSDRRLSRIGNPIKGEWNKAVLWCNMASIAYTGNAFRDRRGRVRVDDWIAETIGSASSVSELYSLLMQGAEHWLKNSRTIHPQAFSLVGWEPASGGGFIPFSGLISNFHDEHANLKTASRDFRWMRVTRHETPRKGTFFLSRTGAMVSREEFRFAFRGIKRVLRQAPNPARVADVLTHLIRVVSQRDPTVGDNVMITCLPKPTTREAAAVLLTSRGGKPDLQTPTFFYRRLDCSDSIAFGPKSVCAHMVQSLDRVEYLNESGGDVEVLATVKLLPSHPLFQEKQ